MTLPAPNDQNPASGGGGRRMSTGIKLTLMGVAGAALLYSCAPSIGSGLSALPMLWLFSNPFYRPPIAAPPCSPGTPGCAPQQATTPGSTSTSPGSRFGSSSTTTTPGATSTPGSTTTPSGPSTRGGFGSSAGTHGTTGSS